ncbi:hypothetical protein EV426DRAFT_629160 [Tirmania nivea]|nr:hypothetical protein EV426DRAFT_629160 [Tirmania nivea]
MSATKSTASPLLDSDSHVAYDLRTRTITYILSALNVTNRDSDTEPSPVLVREEAVLYPPRTGSQDPITSNNITDPTAQVEREIFKLLNQVALLFVREHEIIAVLPKRSGSQAHVNVMVTTDSESDSDELSTEEYLHQAATQDSVPLPMKYLVTRNPRNDSPPGKRTHARSNEVLMALHTMTSPQEMYGYLIKYWHISFAEHVSSIEFLLNHIIVAKSDQRFDRKVLLERYITFRAAPKMHRRFNSPGFICFLQSLRNLSKMQIKTTVAFHMQKWKISSTTLTTHNEAHEEFIPDILYFHRFKSPETMCPYLWNQYENSGEAGADVVYTAETAWEFHQVLIFTLEMAAAAIADFVNAYKLADLPAHDDKLLKRVEKWMGYVHVMVHDSAIFKLHVEALDGDITDLMRKPQLLPTLTPTGDSPASLVSTITKRVDPVAPLQLAPDLNVEDEDNDGCLSDTSIEISAAKAISRAGQQALWLAVSFQQAIQCVCETNSLPKDPISVTLFNPPVRKVPSTEMESWKSVVTSLFPAAADIIATPSSEAEQDYDDIKVHMTPPNDAGIFAEEVINTLEAYAKDHGGKCTLFLPDGESTIKFRGVYHAESILASMAYLSSCNPIPRTIHPEVSDTMNAFRNTYKTIGVSKRCCPVCMKLLSLLMLPQSDSPMATEPLTVLSAHANIYPTSLPPLMPIKVAERLVRWLEQLLKDELVKLVKEKRRFTRPSTQRGRSQDSNGKSPRKKKKKDPVVMPMGEARRAKTTAAGGKRYAKWGEDSGEEGKL